jgi:hypothetical protein
MLFLTAGCGKGTTVRSAPRLEETSAQPSQRPLPNDFFVGWLEAHGHKDVVVDADGVGVANNATRLKASLYGSNEHKNSGFVVETEFTIRLPSKRIITEFLGGTGKTEEEAIKDTMLNFTVTTFHVVYKAFINPLDPHMGMKKLQINGAEREVILGDILSRGNTAEGEVNLNPMREEIRKAISKLALEPSPHWIKIVYSQHESKPMTVAATLDNGDHKGLTDAITALPWPRSDRFYMAKQFIVIK